MFNNQEQKREAYNILKTTFGVKSVLTIFRS